MCSILVLSTDCLIKDTDVSSVFFFQAEDGIRDAQESRGLGDVYKRQVSLLAKAEWYNPGGSIKDRAALNIIRTAERQGAPVSYTHLTLPTILLCVDLGGRRIIKKKNTLKHTHYK